MGNTGAKIIRHALSRDLDGEFDRIAAIMLGLLNNESTRGIGSEMIRETFSRKIADRRGKLVNFPTSTIALIAQMKFDSRFAEYLWEAIPGQQQIQVVSELLAYALMDAREGWVKKCREALIKLGKKKSGKAIARASFYAISELWGMYQGDGIEGSQLRLWQKTFPWLIEQTCACPLSAHDEYETGVVFMEKLNWAMSYCARPPELDMRICQEFSTLDAQQFPQLVELACAVKKRELTRIARAHAPEKHTPPAM